MDRDAILAYPLAAVFGHLSEPAHLPDWLPEVAGVQAGAGQPAGIGICFTLRLWRDGRQIPGTGDLIAYEPPWSAAYRLLAGPDTYVLRLTCTAAGGATQVRIRQADTTAPLAVDLARLQQILATTDQPAASGPGARSQDPDQTRGRRPPGQHPAAGAAPPGAPPPEHR